MYYLVALPAWLLFLLFVSAGMILSIGGLMAARRFAPPVHITGEQIRPTAAICTIIGSLFAILIAFVVVNTWQRYNEQNNMAVQEACELGNLYRDSRGLNQKEEKVLQQLIRNYTKSLVKDAWPSLAEGEENRISWIHFNNLYTELIIYKPADEAERIVFSKMIDHLNRLAGFRRIRLLNSQLPVIPDILWFVLFICGIISVWFTFFFHIGTLKTQIIITSIHSITVSLLLFLVVLLNYPYRSSIRIRPWPIQNLMMDVYPMADAGKINPY